MTPCSSCLCYNLFGSTDMSNREADVEMNNTSAKVANNSGGVAGNNDASSPTGAGDLHGYDSIDNPMLGNIHYWAAANDSKLKVESFFELYCSLLMATHRRAGE